MNRGLGLVFLLCAGPAAAHDALPTNAQPNGWSYPQSCCSNYDCRQMEPGGVKEGPTGYVVPSGEIVQYNDSARVKDSPDGEFHWCSNAGADDGLTICLFVPPRAY